MSTNISSISSITPPNRHIILGSTSVYRRELMNRLSIPFDVQAPDVDETARSDESPLQLAQRLALAKAHAVAQKFPESVVIGSDQVADLEGLALGKPGNFERATVQLRQMRGKTVVFHTAVAVVCHATGFASQDCTSVNVVFRDLSDDEITAYLLAETPYDCAGSAKSEGLGIALLASINSDDPTALVGLPLIRTCSMLRAAGVKLL
jgi:septum formation protein